MSPKVRQSQQQQLGTEQRLKTQMIQALKILSAPMTEIEMILSHELIGNPLLELVDEYNDYEPDDTEKNDTSTNEDNENQDPDSELSKTLEEAKELSSELDAWNENYGDDTYSADTISDSDDDNNYENSIAAEPNLKQEFLNQFDRYDLLEIEFYFIYDLVDAINESGYLPAEFDIYGLAKEYNIPKSRADELHRLILDMPPKGITARNISECLFYQLNEPDQKDTILSKIILEDFDDLLHARYRKIASKHRIDEEEVLFYRGVIGKLDPKPGLRINAGQALYVTPDIIVAKVDDEFDVFVNDFNTPKINISRNYQKILSQADKEKDALRYVKSKVNSAKFVIKAIMVRNKSLENVTRSIIKHQRSFFYENSQELVPLTYYEIAEDLSMNVSTISRVVKNKFADTPFGVIALKDFFVQNAGKTKSEETASKQSVHQQIKVMIDNEDKSQPISDEDIKNIFAERGITLSRRVIAKYREELNIPNSRERRR
ncbi:MAG: RNA polymerase factor sigma-54 [Candidatus Cloacimonetes bacterium]|nr:RNA polymerase factor sigma-54 [Candidatus Cloacimonadota bacterium]